MMSNTLNAVRKILNDAKIEESEVKARIILREIGGLTMEDMLLYREPNNPEDVLDFARKLAKTRAPIQYLLGYADFMGERFIVNESVLIPRDETEFLVNCATEKIKLLQSDEPKMLNVLDIGTGSGCISCMIAKMAPMTAVLGIDISTEALGVALENVRQMNLIKRVLLRKSNLFSDVKKNEKFDIIVSNPPYIPYGTKNIDDTVIKFEPKIALFANDNGMEFYKKIIKDAANYMNFGGYIIFEAGINQAREICMLLEQNGFEVTDVIKDLAGIDRVVAAKMILTDEI